MPVFFKACFQQASVSRRLAPRSEPSVQWGIVKPLRGRPHLNGNMEPMPPQWHELPLEAGVISPIAERCPQGQSG